jgi:hypothetical protein
MNQSYPTTSDDAFLAWLDLYIDLISELGYLPDFNTINDMAFTLAPITSMGAFTSPLTQQNDTYPVSKQWFERRH